MCDYSLAGMPNRLAVEGEELVVHRFATGSIGLSSPCPSQSRWWFPRQTTAVCIPPGARLRLHGIPKGSRRRWHVGITEEVTFTQLSATPYQFRDAVRFDNGTEIRLQDLNEGMRVDVLSLSSEDFQHQEHQQIEEEYQRIFTR